MTAGTSAQSPLSPHLFEILLVLAEGPAHGYGIVAEIRARTGSRVELSTSTLYRGIERLLRKGLIAEAVPKTVEASGGPPRKYYRITERGQRIAEAESRRLQELLPLAEARFLSPRSSR